MATGGSTDLRRCGKPERGSGVRNARHVRDATGETWVFCGPLRFKPTLWKQSETEKSREREREEAQLLNPLAPTAHLSRPISTIVSKHRICPTFGASRSFISQLYCLYIHQTKASRTCRPYAAAWILLDLCGIPSDHNESCGNSGRRPVAPLHPTSHQE